MTLMRSLALAETVLASLVIAGVAFHANHRDPLELCFVSPSFQPLRLRPSGSSESRGMYSSVLIDRRPVAICPVNGIGSPCVAQSELISRRLGARRPRSFLNAIVSQYRGGGGGGGMRRGGGRFGERRFDTAPKGPPMNGDILAPEVRVIASNPDGRDEMLGILTRSEALAQAEARVCDFYRFAYTITTRAERTK